MYVGLEKKCKLVPSKIIDKVRECIIILLCNNANHMKFTFRKIRKNGVLLVKYGSLSTRK